ncbi:Glycosyltransferase family 52 [Vibrio crassostreae]|nr:Glycosyltransferase family 52 [Vibrio crassostreae]CAK3205160.1 Glycosyltransferase family 52 [Vibrio crassostreae]CAK3232138.1 Glycosyltransferase family 52 [Vibrio crassostreae]CAK3242453.1 Glycosyltransferase family 52 [Vibrio crassostreae]CAK3309559.1 Glycosyltransferase family 52 [Vibrio crassostreae]
MNSTHKDIYVCSTVRHLLLSLYKAQDEINPSTIIYFYDYQDVDPKDIDTDQLPEKIELVLMNRESLVNHIKKIGYIGKCILFCSLRGWSIPEPLKRILVSSIYESNNNVDLKGGINKLFLFNDNNKMSRLFRLLVKSYSMIEDGMGNYVKHQIDDKPKQLFRLLSNQPPKHYVFGERKQCDHIYVIHPEKLPKSVQHKGRRLVLSKDKAKISKIQQCFKFDSTNNFDNKTLIIATQPIFNKLKGKLKDNGFFYDIYSRLILESKHKGLTPILKLHPKESESDYLSFKEKGVRFLSNKLPLEIYLLSSKDKVNIISINSSAGMGIEEYCEIYKLIPDSKVHDLENILIELEKKQDSLQDLISLQLSNIK